MFKFITLKAFFNVGEVSREWAIRLRNANFRGYLNRYLIKDCLGGLNNGFVRITF